MIGKGVSYGALSVINAISTGKVAAFGIDLKTEATVQLVPEKEFSVEIDGHPAEDTTLARLSVEEMLRRYPGSGMNGAVIKNHLECPYIQRSEKQQFRREFYYIGCRRGPPRSYRSSGDRTDRCERRYQGRRQYYRGL